MLQINRQRNRATHLIVWVVGCQKWSREILTKRMGIEMKSKNKIMLAGIVAVLTVNSVFAYEDYDVEPKNYAIQALLGGVRYDDLVFPSNDGDADSTTDMSTLPQLGGAWSTLPKGEKLQFGLEATFV